MGVAALPWRTGAVVGMVAIALTSPKYSPLTAILNALDGTHNHTANNPYLHGNFAPVHDERCDSDLPVIEGAIPADIDGVFIRQGPNPALPPRGKYHWCVRWPHTPRGSHAHLSRDASSPAPRRAAQV